MADEKGGMFGEKGKKIAEKGSEVYREFTSKGDEKSEEKGGEKGPGEHGQMPYDETGGQSPEMSREGKETDQ